MQKQYWLILSLTIFTIPLFAQLDKYTEEWFSKQAYSVINYEGEEFVQHSSTEQYVLGKLTDVLMIDELLKLSQEDKSLFKTKVNLDSLLKAAILPDPLIPWVEYNFDEALKIKTLKDLLQVQMQIGSDVVSDYFINMIGIEMFFTHLNQRLPDNRVHLMYRDVKCYFSKLTGNDSQLQMKDVFAPNRQKLIGAIQKTISQDFANEMEPSLKTLNNYFEMFPANQRMYIYLINDAEPANILGIISDNFDKEKAGKKRYKNYTKHIEKPLIKRLGIKKQYNHYFEYVSTASDILHFTGSLEYLDGKRLHFVFVIRLPEIDTEIAAEKSLKALREMIGDQDKMKKLSQLQTPKIELNSNF